MKIYHIFLKLDFTNIKIVSHHLKYRCRDLAMINFGKNIQSPLIPHQFINQFQNFQNISLNNSAFAHQKTFQSASLIFSYSNLM